jgi:hypothetical protein
MARNRARDEKEYPPCRIETAERVRNSPLRSVPKEVPKAFLVHVVQYA